MSSDWDRELDQRVKEALAGHFAGPNEPAFKTRVASTIKRLPVRDTEWDVLAGWARPRIVAAAIAAGFLLGVATWQQWRSRGGERVPGSSPVSVAVLETGPGAVLPVVNLIMEDR